MKILNNVCNMTPRQLATCLDILGAGQLDVALVVHVDYICEHCLIEKFNIGANGEVFTYYVYKTKQWIYSERLTRAMLAIGLMNEDGTFIEEKARELHPDYEGQWGVNSGYDPE
jgi:hypothetical protein